MNRSIVFEVWPLMSIPSSPITAIASGRTPVASVPPLATSKRSPAQARSIPSAICERAELWMQTKRTRRLVIWASLAACSGTGCGQVVKDP